MEDKEIIDLYWARSQRAITETDKKYGSFCHSIAYNILANRQDSEECVNDTYRRTWETIPPEAPSVLATYLGMLTRCIALDRYSAFARDFLRERGGREKGSGKTGGIWL